MSKSVFEFEKYKDGVMVTKFLEGPDIIEVPEELGGQKVVAIGPECFRENGIMVTEIKLPDTVRELKPDAFAYTVSLEKLHLPEGLEKIGADHLLASGLAEAYIPASVEHIERPELTDRTFKVSPDNKKYFSDGYGLYEKDNEDVRLIAVNASETRENYKIKDGTKEISFNVFRDAAAVGCLYIPESLNFIKEGALSYNGGVVNNEKGVKSVKVSERNPKFTIVSHMFCERREDGSLKVLRYFGGERVRIPEDVREIGLESFKNTAVEEFFIPEGVKKINTGAFSGCPIKVCHIGDNVINFGDEDRFTMETFLECFGKNGRIYDPDVLDDFLMEQYLTPGRVRMICTRLKYPLGLSEKNKSGLFRRIKDEIHIAIDMISDIKDMQTVEMMGELGFFTADNIDSIIEQMSIVDKKELIAWFMSYKNTNFKSDGWYDFSF